MDATVDSGNAAATSGTVIADPFIRFDDVSLRYGGPGGTLAVEGATIDIPKGGFVSIVGPSGCGKSTLLKMVSGLIAPTAGRVVVGGKPVTGPLGFVGMAFQNPTPLPWYSVIDNVMLPLRIVEPYRSTFRARYDEYRAKAEALLEMVGLKGFGEKKPWQLSGGMLQRASLCRALIHEPALLLLDEPFGALDAFTREELWQVLQELWLARRPTVMLITHDLAESVLLSETVFVMSARPGRLLHSEAVPFARPRGLDVMYEPEFVSMVHRLRTRIGNARADGMKGA
ncbi:MAG: ABC transporter ATP-binding protein [Rhodocyclaceae bacterium]|jgi:NitT/TauT family transport system ATP-binding protein|nr:ABC transporter ATP-binding protein [Rhodocyclaceae bacterium]MCA3073031.1 ABC transporter ATP-binding protein [Rhodocyclaceae bacterium]MCA3088693.1 ABC transporter ATP-binding protein [Rhodocyclaceae bacterium]MCA3092523.1 ABC transporter ATP-binding protein [Rhodocyclaceae bacterium]MCA3097355.1 ABC transporter ATP-binding protein [Rhodocyclaceae bacterium]